MATVLVSGVLHVTAELLSHMHDLRDTARATLANTAGRIANYEAQAQRQPKTCPQGTETEHASRSGTAARSKLKTYRCCSDQRKIRHAAVHNTLGGTMASSSGVASDKKHVFVIGGGVIGVTSAYFLAKQGYRVTVLEAQPPPVASVTSFANAGVVRATKTTALASPTSVLQVWPHCPYTCGVRQLTRLDVSLACRWRAPHGK